MRFILVFLSVFVSSVFAQKIKLDEIDTVAKETNVSPFFFQNDFSVGYFHQLQERTHIDHEQFSKITAIAPDNKALLESERKWRIFSYVLTGLFISQVDVEITSKITPNYADLPYSPIYRNIKLEQNIDFVDPRTRYGVSRNTNHSK
jgi:hypothetical protein